jgi:hypothetical protein
MLTVSTRAVADFKVLPFRFITKLYSKIQHLSLAQNPQLRLHFVGVSLL